MILTLIKPQNGNVRFKVGVSTLLNQAEHLASIPIQEFCDDAFRDDDPHVHESFLRLFDAIAEVRGARDPQTVFIAHDNAMPLYDQKVRHAWQLVTQRTYVPESRRNESTKIENDLTLVKIEIKND